MTSLPTEVVSVITNFLPNDDITDLMLLSRRFNGLVTPRLRKINKEMATMDQHIESFMPIPAPEPTDCEWISQLNLKKFEPMGSAAKHRMKHVFEKEEDDLLHCLRRAGGWNVPDLKTDLLDGFKKNMWSDSMTQLSYAFWVPWSRNRNSVKSTIFRGIWRDTLNF